MKFHVDIEPQLPIICAVCRRPVETVKSYYDPAKRKRVMVARCHGSEDETSVEDAVLEDSGVRVLSFGWRRG